MFDWLVLSFPFDVDQFKRKEWWREMQSHSWWTTWRQLRFCPISRKLVDDWIMCIVSRYFCRYCHILEGHIREQRLCLDCIPLPPQFRSMNSLATYDYSSWKSRNNIGTAGKTPRTHPNGSLLPFWLGKYMKRDRISPVIARKVFKEPCNMKVFIICNYEKKLGWQILD